MKVLVIGADGQLGKDVVAVLKENGDDFFGATRGDVDISKEDEVERILEKVMPDAVINCAAYHDVPKCEESPKLAIDTNGHAVFNLAKKCGEHGVKFMTVSTDYVFEGSKVDGYTEEDTPNPLMWYGKSKLAGEWLALGVNPNVFVVRTQSLYGLSGPKGKGLNFVDLMLKLSSERDELKVDQCRMSPTWTYPLAKNLVALLKTDAFGLYHMSCNESTTWYEFAKEIMKVAGRDVKVTPVGNDFYPKNFKRPENTYLINDKLQKMGLDLMPSWKEALHGYLAQKKIGVNI